LIALRWCDVNVWSQQQRWDVQKTALLDSLKELATAETFLFRLVYTFSETKTQQGCRTRGEMPRTMNMPTQSAISGERDWQWKSCVAGRLALSFRRLITFKRVFNRAKQGDFNDIWDKQLPELLAAKRELGETIRRLLEFDPQPGGGELSLSSHITPLSSESLATPGPGP
jgi:hypothetical protein